MYRTEAGLRISATDLSHFLSCRHLTALDLAVANKERTKPGRFEDPLLTLLWKRGKEHEKAYVEKLCRDGLDVVDLSDIALTEPDKAIAQTLDAMRGGADIIVQAALQHESWFGYADVLRRIPVKSELGSWSYEAIDTKLARETRAGTVMQLGLYSAMLKQIQGEVPERFHVVVPGLGGTPSMQHTFRVDDFAAYFRLIQGQLLAASEMDPRELAELTYPEPVDHCDICRWRSACNEKRKADDHLSLVAGLGRLHRRELESRDIRTLAALAGLPFPIAFKPNRGSRETYGRAREQALVQLHSRGMPAPLYTLRPPEQVKDPTVPAEPRGLCRLPEPSPGDVFLDLEGDLFADEGGREYLFGIITRDDGSPSYRSWWAVTAHEERVAFESVMDFIMERLDRFPDMHVYHYAPYEPTAFKKLMGRHATREEELDRLLRGGRFIDLYSVVRQAMWVGVESYSIKRLEPAYHFTRDVDLPDASRALRRMEYALQVRQPTLLPVEDREIIQGYNRDDCVSTLRLRDWLESVRVDAESKGIPCPRPPLVPDEPPENVSEMDAAVRNLRERLLGGGPDIQEDGDDEQEALPGSGVPEGAVDDDEAVAGSGVPEERDDRDDEQQARWILSYLLDYHRREDKATWWEYYHLRALAEEDLLDERKAIAGLQYTNRVDRGGLYKNGKPKGKVVDRYTYPEQEMEVDRGATLNTATVKSWGKVVAVDRLQRTIDIEKSRGKAEIHPSAVFEFKHVPAKEAAAALFRLGESVAVAGAVDALDRSPATELLLRRAPTLRSGSFAQRPGESVVDFAVRVGLQLDNSLLAIQGPPGAGKTHTGAEMICALVSQGKSVGVTANSHKVIRNLLEKCVETAKKKGMGLVVAHKDGEDPDEDEESSGAIQSIESNETADQVLTSGEVQVLGGTAWLWAREELTRAVDVLFVDEAGQMALANVLAVSQAAKSIVLLGDPQQLDQPTKASHPDGVAVPALQHFLGEQQTMPPDRGIFLPVTWRMSPALCQFTSELYYERKLHSKPGLEQQELVNAGKLSGSSLWAVDVEHDGNRNHSPEEVEVIANLVAHLTSPGVKWKDEDGKARQVGLDEIRIVSPYNTQVNRLLERLPTGAHVGTVDKFQGQEAPVVIYSMATSQPEDAPRGMDFLYNPNRFNVATSRARCAVILVASPHLFTPECRTVKQMRLANGFCRYRELANRLVV